MALTTVQFRDGTKVVVTDWENRSIHPPRSPKKLKLLRVYQTKKQWYAKVHYKAEGQSVWVVKRWSLDADSKKHAEKVAKTLIILELA